MLGVAITAGNNILFIIVQIVDSCFYSVVQEKDAQIQSMLECRG
jgi:hypothetical protein